MNLKEAEETFKTISSSTWTGLAEDLVKGAVRYARLRTNWALAGSAERLEMDAKRTRAHDTFIDCCNILSRNMAKVGEDTRWREKMGDDRKVFGDFACHLHCLLGIQAR